MLKSSVIFSTILATSFISLSSSASLSQSSVEEIAQLQFICQTEQTPPMTVAVINGQTETIASWYSEYLLSEQSPAEICQEVAQKLQKRYENQQTSLFAYEPIVGQERWDVERWDVCLVTEIGQKCTEEGSELLFSLNNKYKEPAECVLQSTEPNQCPPQIRTRGSVISVPGGQGYSPRWLTQFFRSW